MRAVLLLLALWAGPAAADLVVATRTIPPQTVIGPEDLSISESDVPGGVSDPDELIGMEARVALYAGRPIRLQDVGPPAVVERNSVISLVYDAGLLRISTEGRALDRAGPGDVIRVMNLASRSTVTARIGADGVGYVSN